MIIYFVDKTINVINNQKTINEEFKSLDKGIIEDKDLFLIEFKDLIKKNKIRSKLLNDNIKIINTYYNKRDLFYLESIFTELGFYKVEFEDIRKLFTYIDATYIEINNTYATIYLNNKMIIDIKYALDIINIFKNELKENIVLFGTNKLISDIKMKNKNIYFLDDCNDFIIKKFIK